ncbi:MAG: hypothetical protein KDK05_30795, partial [Candidatus Competibacteraceae bacterium]|nr:hypothetical protein [Candidatus Competibacteraceae bacterium]
MASGINLLQIGFEVAGEGMPLPISPDHVDNAKRWDFASLHHQPTRATNLLLASCFLLLASCFLLLASCFECEMKTRYSMLGKAF